MQHLVGELARDPWRTRRRALWAVGGALIIAACVAGALRDPQPRCDGAEPQAAAIWDAQAQSQVAAAFHATGLPYAADTFAKVDRGLRQWQVTWARGHREACEATHARHEQSEALLDRRMQCLTRAKAETAALVSLLRRADRTSVDRATQASLEVGASDTCADPAALSAAAPPRDPVVRVEVDSLREALARLAALRRLGQWKDALALGRGLVERARRTAYGPLVAEVLVSEASLELTADGDIDAAIERLYEAARAGSLANDDAVVAGALSNLVFAYGSKKRAFDAAEVAYRVALAAVARAGNPPRRVAELDLYRAYTLSRKGDFAGALDHARAALAEQSAIYGPQSYQAANALGTVAGAMKRLGHAADAQPLMDRAIAIAEQALGPLHPNLGTIVENAGANLRELGDIDGAAALLERAVKIGEARGEPDNPGLAHRLEALAAVRFLQRRLVEARALMERAIAIHVARQGADTPELGTSYATLAEIARLEGDPAQAHRLYQQAMVIDRKTYGDSHASVADDYRDDAVALIALGQLTEARTAIDRALAIAKQTGGEDHPDFGDVLRVEGELRCAEQRCAEAVELFRRAVALHEKETGAGSSVLVEPLVGLCGALLAAGDPAGARAAGDRAVALGGKAPIDLLAAARFCVARSAWLTGDRELARQQARVARDTLAGLAFPARLRPDVERWLAEHP